MELLKKKNITRTLRKERKGHYIKKSIMKERNMKERNMKECDLEKVQHESSET